MTQKYHEIDTCCLMCCHGLLAGRKRRAWKPPETQPPQHLRCSNACGDAAQGWCEQKFYLGLAVSNIVSCLVVWSPRTCKSKILRRVFFLFFCFFCFLKKQQTQNPIDRPSVRTGGGFFESCCVIHSGALLSKALEVKTLLVEHL